MRATGDSKSVFLSLATSLAGVVLSVRLSVGQDHILAPYRAQQERILAQNASLGGAFGPKHDVDKSGYVDLVFGPRWRGGKHGLALLTDLRRVDEVTLDCLPIDEGVVQYLRKWQGLKGLHVTNSLLSNAAMSHLKHIPQLQLLWLSGTGATDDTLESLTCLRLMWLIIEPRSEVTDAGLCHLRSMKRLLCLRLIGANVVGNGVSYLAKLENLRELSLADGKIDDSGLSYLRPLQRLDRLDLSRTKVVGPGLADLRDLRGLHCLLLDETPISADGLRNVSQLRNLAVLSLNGTNITDREISLLEGLERLTMLSLQNTRVTDSGMKVLARLPRLATAIDPQGNIVIFKSEWAASDNGGHLLSTLDSGRRLLLWTDLGVRTVDWGLLQQLRQERRPQGPGGTP